MNAKVKATLDRLPEIVKYLLVLAVIAFISFLLPNHVKFKYAYEQGRTWGYEDLNAPFDFAIQKTPEEIEKARQVLDKEFSPYYQLRAEIAKQKLEEFDTAFQKQLTIVKEEGQFRDVVRSPAKYRSYGKQILQKIYDYGVIRIAPEHERRDKNFVINVVKGNTQQKQVLQNVWTVIKAQEALHDSLLFASHLRESEFLLYLLRPLIVPNVRYNELLTREEKNRLLSQIATTRGAVKKGNLIVAKGDIVTEETFQKLTSFKNKYEAEIIKQKSYLWVQLGYFLLTALILGVFLAYVRTFDRAVFNKLSSLVFILLWVVLFSYLVYAVRQIDALSTYLIPFCIVPIVIKHFFSERLAFFTHIVVVLIASFLSSLGYEFAFVQILAGIVGVLGITDARHWGKFFGSVFYIGLTYAAAFLGLALVQEGSITTIDGKMYVWILLNMTLTMLAFPLIPLLERVFGFTSAISLVELSDMSRPLLKELSLKAPGTLQHSLQVANLCEAAANEIGADPLLVKVGALYHDIGKIKNPTCFIENQNGGNLHKAISCVESAQMIIAHVADGITIAKKHRLPKVLVDFIQTHHGTTRVEYFLRSFKKENPEKVCDESLFEYPGPRPKSREETILMMADSLEAAAKSLDHPTGQDIDELVEKITAHKIKGRQFEESEMTFEELEKCKIVFKLLLRSMNHVRVEYPEE